MELWAFIPIAAILGLWAFLISSSMAKARLRELQIRERIAMIEKGLMPAPEVDPRGFERAMGRDRSPYRRSATRHRSAGVTLVGVGLGLMVMIAFAADDPQKAIGVGGFIVMLGAAFLVNGLFDQRRLEDELARTSSSTPAVDGPKTD
jgi:hypothetical protein